LIETIPKESDDKNTIEDKKSKIESEEESNSIKAMENESDEKNKIESTLLNILSKSK